MKSMTLLSKFYDSKKRDNPRLSLKALAEKLEISKSYTHQILRGDRTPPLSIVDNLCRLLDIDDVSKDLLINQLFLQKGFIRNRAKSALEKEKFKVDSQKNWHSIAKKEISLIRNWHYMPILDSTLLKDYDGTSSFIAKKLGVETQMVKAAFMELESLGYLVRNKRGWLVKAFKFVEFNSKNFRTEIRNYHKQSLKKTEQCLTHQISDEDVEMRQVNHFLMSCRAKDIPIVKQKIAAFTQQLVEEFGSKEIPDMIYQLGVQLVPVTGKNNSNRK